MRRNTLLVDAGIAVVLAILVIVISPGLAVVGLLAILVLLVCAVSFGVDRLRRRRRRTNPARELRRSTQAPRPRGR
jgi:ABC-type bacteriocin/lantibiotic exporter with double-glycine peptidase domain